LASQIAFVIENIGEYKQVKVLACVGGSSMKDSINLIKNGVHVVVGTPGRVFDFLKRGILKTDYLKLFVMDEADEMLEVGFAD
jgi:translation initiation factor 4A